MYHPAAALRSEEMLKAFQEDFEKNKEILLNPEKANFFQDKKEEDDPQISLFN
jgi:hypothetical protein